MKKVIVIILILIVGFALGWWFNEMNGFSKEVALDNHSNLNIYESEIDIENSNIVHEEFEEFFYRFMIEPKFQLSRIQFPLEIVHFKDGFPGEEIETTYLQSDKWEHNSYYLDKISIPIIYDTYKMALRNTDERVFVWSGVENGIFVSSYFKRIDGKWFLIKEEDLST